MLLGEGEEAYSGDTGRGKSREGGAMLLGEGAPAGSAAGAAGTAGAAKRARRTTPEARSV